MAAHQAPLSLGFSRQEHWSGLPFPSPMHESEKWKWSRSVVSDPQRPHELQPTRLLRPLDFPGKSTGVGCHCLLHPLVMEIDNSIRGCLHPPLLKNNLCESPMWAVGVEHLCFGCVSPTFGDWANCFLRFLNVGRLSRISRTCLYSKIILLEEINGTGAHGQG